MFTGIVEELGVIKSLSKHLEGARLQIEAQKVLSDVSIGDSISVNGCCLTVVEYHPTHWSCDIVKETLQKTTFPHLEVGDRVNLERSVRLQDRLGGHLVQGHVDGLGKIKAKNDLKDGSWWVTIETPPDLLRYIIQKGSIAVDGVSLTVADVKDSTFSFAMIPHTAAVTSLGYKSTGSLVNLEVDMIAKYIERLIR